MEKYLIIIDNYWEVENYYFSNKKEAIKQYKLYKKEIDAEIKIYKIEEIKIIKGE